MRTLLPARAVLTVLPVTSMNLCRKTALLFEIVPVLTEMAMAISVRKKPLSESATALPPRHVVHESTAMALLLISARNHRKRKSFCDIAMAISRIGISFSMGHDVITAPGHWLKTTSKDLFSLSRGLSEEGKTIWRIAMAISKNQFWLSRKPRDYHIIRHRVKTTSMDRFSKADGPFERGKNASAYCHGPTPEKEMLLGL